MNVPRPGRKVDFGRSDAMRPVRLMRQPGEGFYSRSGKRLLDICIVLLMLPFVVPAIAVLMLLIARDGHSPLYSQERVGFGGRVFTFWKLRTMVPNAKTHLDDYLANNADAQREWTTYQKLSCDPRITPIGQLLRKSSLDELPQLWNVLKGDMSLVGPRPMMPEQRELYPGSAYFSLLPGVTGLWQVSDRNDSTFAQRAEFDASYKKDLSLMTDLRVLFATVGVVLRGTGR